MITILGYHISVIRPGSYYRPQIPKLYPKYRYRSREIKLTLVEKRRIAYELGYEFRDIAEEKGQTA